MSGSVQCEERASLQTICRSRKTVGSGRVGRSVGRVGSGRSGRAHPGLGGQTSLCNRSVGAGRTGGNLQIVCNEALSSHRTLPLILAFYVS